MLRNQCLCRTAYLKINTTNYQKYTKLYDGLTTEQCIYAALKELNAINIYEMSKTNLYCM